ncbi:MAG: ABC transporter substrate-binding protein [Bacteriovoracaceae bacterium]|nr:ABC transporter substrate-binding protein [Bacteriovoracaceae bacterium]
MSKRILVSILSLTLFALSCSREQNFDEKVLNLISSQKIKGFDPIYAADLYSANEVGKVYETLLEFHYLKRPYELTPNLAESMPEVSKDGLTYTFKIKKGVKFHDSKAFADGKGRELKADDFVYSFKRLGDPKLQSTGWWVWDGKIAGLNEWREKNSTAEKVNYAEEISGLKKIDDYTLQVKLNKPFPQFLYSLAMPFTSVVAHEAVEKFGQEFQNYPVGTGPFVLDYFDNSNRIVYKRNPTFRDKFYPSEGEASDESQGLLSDAGKKLPLVEKIIVNIVIEAQPQWLNFQKGSADLLGVPKDNFDQAIVGGKEIAPEMAKKGIRLSMVPSLDVTYIAFNHNDPLFTSNLKLRQALSLAYDRVESNKLFFNNTAQIAQSIIPPGIAGHKKEYKNAFVDRDLERAKKLLKEAGYPEGKGLPELTYETVGSTVSRQQGEFFAKCMSDIGVKVKISTNTWPELVKKTNTKTAQMFGMAWGADYPDAENFLSLMYGPNESPGSNSSNYKNAAFDKIFAQAAIMQDSPERTALYEKLYEMVGDDVPWIYGVHRTTVSLNHGWLKNYKYIEFNHTQSQYLNVDLETKKELLKKF